MNPLFRPKTIKTILESAPVVIQGAGKLIQLIKEKDSGTTPQKQLTEDETGRKQDIPLTLDSLKSDIDRLENRLKENADSDVEQIKLIEELARQNETLAETITKNYNRLTVLTIITGLAVFFAFLGILLALR